MIAGGTRTRTVLTVALTSAIAAVVYILMPVTGQAVAQTRTPTHAAAKAQPKAQPHTAAKKAAQAPAPDRGAARTRAGSHKAAPAPLQWVTTTLWLWYGGQPRSALVSRPANIPLATLPVLVELHGCCVPAEVEQARTGFLSVTGPAVVIFPAGYAMTWNAGACCGEAQQENVDDVGFITSLVENVLLFNPLADRSRVFLAGYSNGGRMAFRVACEAPSLFAGLAVFGAVNAISCPNPPAMSVLEIAGSRDPEIVIGPGGNHLSVNGYSTPTVLEQMGYYTQADHCRPQPAVVSAGTVTTSTWGGCAASRVDQMEVIAGADHGWPASAAAMMWGFFSGLPPQAHS